MQWADEIGGLGRRHDDAHRALAVALAGEPRIAGRDDRDASGADALQAQLNAQSAGVVLVREDEPGRAIVGCQRADGMFEIVGADEQLLDDNPRDRP